MVESVRDLVDASEIDNLKLTDRRCITRRCGDEKGPPQEAGPHCQPSHRETPKLSAMANTPSGSPRTVR